MLEKAFYRIMARGTNAVMAVSSRSSTARSVFKPKTNNIVGVQITDLSHIRAPVTFSTVRALHRAFDIAHSHIYNSGGVSGWRVSFFKNRQTFMRKISVR